MSAQADNQPKATLPRLQSPEKVFTPMTRYLNFLALSLLLALGIVLPSIAPAADQPQPDPAGGITEISLQRTWCLGACPVDELTLSPNGTAHYCGQMHTLLLGDYQGKFWKQDFDQLAQWLKAQGFFELKESYGFANPDAPNQIISLVKNGQRKTVTIHEPSPLLWSVQKVIQGTAADIKWQAVSSGVRGTITWRYKTSPEFPERTAFRPLSKEIVFIRRSDDKQDFVVRTDEDGKYEIPLRPGTYTLKILGHTENSTTGESQQSIVVQPEEFNEASTQFEIVREPPAVKPAP